MVCCWTTLIRIEHIQASCPSFNGLLIAGIDYKKSTMVIENQTIVLDIW